MSGERDGHAPTIGLANKLWHADVDDLNAGEHGDKAEER